MMFTRLWKAQYPTVEPPTEEKNIEYTSAVITMVGLTSGQGDRLVLLQYSCFEHQRRMSAKK